MEKMDLSVPYYSDMSRISNSNIGWFLNKGPAYLFSMLNGTGEEETGPQLDRGTMIHEYILRPEEFWYDYILFTGERPASAQQLKFCEELINSVELIPDNALLEAYKASYSVTVKDDSKTLLKAKEMASTLNPYIETLRISKVSNKKIITGADFHLLQNIDSALTEHKLAYKLLRPEGEYHHEFQINWEYKTKYGNILCKSLLDHIKFDLINHKVTIVDLKTTIHIQDFIKSIEQYDYFRQMEYYKQAAIWYIKHILGLNPDDFTFDIYIVAVDSIKGDSCRVFKVDDKSLTIPKLKITYALNMIKWHMVNNKWGHTREYYDGDGSELLNVKCSMADNYDIYNIY